MNLSCELQNLQVWFFSIWYSKGVCFSNIHNCLQCKKSTCRSVDWWLLLRSSNLWTLCAQHSLHWRFVPIHMPRRQDLNYLLYQCVILVLCCILHMIIIFSQNQLKSAIVSDNSKGGGDPRFLVPNWYWCLPIFKKI